MYYPKFVVIGDYSFISASTHNWQCKMEQTIPFSGSISGSVSASISANPEASKNTYGLIEWLKVNRLTQTNRILAKKIQKDYFGAERVDHNTLTKVCGGKMSVLIENSCYKNARLQFHRGYEKLNHLFARTMLKNKLQIRKHLMRQATLQANKSKLLIRKNTAIFLKTMRLGIRGCIEAKNSLQTSLFGQYLKKQYQEANQTVIDMYHKVFCIQNVLKIKKVVQTIGAMFTQYSFGSLFQLKSMFSALQIPQDSLICNVCLGPNRNMVFLPCRHFTVCEDCSLYILRSQRRCPICREYIQEAVKIYT